MPPFEPEELVGEGYEVNRKVSLGVATTVGDE